MQIESFSAFRNFSVIAEVIPEDMENKTKKEGHHSPPPSYMIDTGLFLLEFPPETCKTN